LKEGFVIDKSGAPTETELEKINALSRRQLSKDEVYVFSVVLCDNDIDRDFERFNEKALETLSELYIGKTGIFDHSFKGRDQVARVFDAFVERPEGQVTKTGQSYCRLKAKAYMPVTRKNADLITEIDAGIKKEVSVGCSVGKAVCSICGADRREHSCGHKKGRYYGKGAKRELCYDELCEPKDAYEFSFVAVPAQPRAGVVKGFFPTKGGEKMDFESIKKAFEGEEEITLSADEQKQLLSRINELEKLASFGKCQMENLKKEVSRLGGIARPEIGIKNIENLVKSLDADGLNTLKKVFESEAGERIPMPRQLDAEKGEKLPENDGFII